MGPVPDPRRARGRGRSLGFGLVAALSIAASGCASMGPGGTKSDERYRSEYAVPQAIYVSSRVGATSLRGDFDGNTQIVGPDTIVVPDAGAGNASAFVLGYMRDGYAFELAYTRTSYDDLETEGIAMNALYYLRANEALQPYGLIGLAFPWATLDDASTDGMSIGDADLSSGIGLRLAGGVAWMFGRRVALDLRGGYTWQEFAEAEGVAGSSGTIDDAVNGPQFELSVGLTFFHLMRGGG